MKNVFIIMFLLTILVSCKKEGKPQSDIDEDIITKYIADHDLNAIATGSGLYYVIDEEGSGDQPNSQSTVKVFYRGKLSDGSVFDESDISGATFSLNAVINGWQEGIPKFKEGGEGLLLIPSELGYGSSGNNGIPSNSVLIFEVRLIEVL